MYFWIFIFSIFLLLFIYLKFIKDPEIGIGIKILHYVMVFIYSIAGMKPKSNFSRNLMNTILFIPEPHTKKGLQGLDLNIQHFEEKNKFVKIRIFEDTNLKQKNKPIFVFIHGGKYKFRNFFMIFFL